MGLDERSYEPFHSDFSDGVRQKVLNKFGCYAYKILYNYNVKTILDMLKQNKTCSVNVVLFCLCRLAGSSQNTQRKCVQGMSCHAMTVDTL